MTARAASRPFAPIDPDRLTDAQQAIAGRLLGGPRRKLGPVWRALLHNPGIAGPIEALGEHVRYHGAVPTALIELMILVMSRDRGIRYLCDVHAPIARAAGLAQDKIDAVLRGEAPAGPSPEEELVWRLAKKLRRTPVIGRALSEEIVGRLGEAGLVELVGVAGYYFVMFAGLDLVLTPEQRYPARRRGRGTKDI